MSLAPGLKSSKPAPRDKECHPPGDIGILPMLVCHWLLVSQCSIVLHVCYCWLAGGCPGIRRPVIQPFFVSLAATWHAAFGGLVGERYKMGRVTWFFLTPIPGHPRLAQQCFLPTAYCLLPTAYCLRRFPRPYNQLSVRTAYKRRIGNGKFFSQAFNSSMAQFFVCIAAQHYLEFYELP